MKAIVIKINDQIISCEHISDLSTKQFLDYQKEAKRNIELKEHEISVLLDKVDELSKDICSLNEKLNNQQHQINVITGVEEESEATE